MKDKRIVAFVGLPGSGKTTKAFEMIDAEPGEYARVNKDDLRAMIFAGKHSRAREEIVKAVRDDAIKRFLSNGYNVIVDDTNLNPNHLERFKELAEWNGAVLEVDRSFLEVPVEECIRRDLKRGEKVGEKVILGMYNSYLQDQEPEYPRDENLPDCLIVDVDGTLAIHQGRGPFNYERAGEDKPNMDVVNMVKGLYYVHEPERVFFFSAREDVGNCRKITEEWLWDYVIGEFPMGVTYKLVLRSEGDHRKDAVVKREMFDQFVRNHFNPLAVVDDRKQVIDMWRGLGLTVFDVAGHRF